MIGGLHAREWMPPEICLSLAADLLEAYDTGTGLTYASVHYSAAQIRETMETYHIYLVPTCNPDGLHYAKTHDSIGGLLGWRRNMSTTSWYARPSQDLLGGAPPSRAAPDRGIGAPCRISHGIANPSPLEGRR